MKKVFAYQINPEFQESPLMYSDEPFDGIAICGNKDYSPLCCKEFEDCKYALEAGEIADFLDDIIRLKDYSFYKNLSELFADLIKPVYKNRYSTRDVHRLKDIFTRYGYGPASEDEKALLELLSIYTGSDWKTKTIKGSCQSDWNEVFYNAKVWSDDDIKHIEIEYFNTGSEWEVSDHNEPGDGYCVYCYGWNADEIKKEIASAEGCNPEDIRLYGFDGYYQT